MDEQLFNQCPIYNGEMEKKKVKKVLTGGGNTATVEVEAEVCTLCGERLFAPETIRQFETIREDLQTGNTEHLSISGKAFKVS